MLDYRYQLLIDTYSSLTIEEQASSHPSEMLSQVLSSFDAWFAHHITTHLAIHNGNLSIWKKMIGLDVGGY